MLCLEWKVASPVFYNFYFTFAHLQIGIRHHKLVEWEVDTAIIKPESSVWDFVQDVVQDLVWDMIGDLLVGLSRRRTETDEGASTTGHLAKPLNIAPSCNARTNDGASTRCSLEHLVTSRLLVLWNHLVTCAPVYLPCFGYSYSFFLSAFCPGTFACVPGSCKSSSRCLRNKVLGHEINPFRGLGGMWVWKFAFKIASLPPFFHRRNLVPAID